jgi:hypothetical protein
MQRSVLRKVPNLPWFVRLVRANMWMKTRVQHWLNDTDRPREVVEAQLYAFFNLGARSTPRLGRFTPEKEPVPTVQEAGQV